VALKVVSPQVVHKVDVGGVALGLGDAAAVRAAYREVIGAVQSRQPEAFVRGAFVQQMAAKGVEMILGLKRDPLFGPLVMFGLGGIFVEVFQDVTFRIAPVRPLGARRMLEEIRAHKILKGFRNQPPADREALAACIERLSQLALAFPEIEELDVNPLMVYPQGQGVRAVDARILLKAPDQGG
jgi:acetyltransferase